MTTNAIYQLIPQLAAMMNIFSQMITEHVARLLNQLYLYGDATDGQVSWMRLQAGAVLAVAFLGGVSGIAAAFFPKVGDLQDRPPVPDGIWQAMSQKLNDNYYMRTTFKTAAKVFPSIGTGADTLFRSQTTQDEAKRTILSQVRFQAAQDGQSSNQEAIRKASELGSRIQQLCAQGA